MNKVAWSHPKFESLLASCGMDKKIHIRSEVKAGEWQVVKTEETQSEVLTLAWAPWEYGLILVAGCADGQLIVLKHNGGISWSQ